MHTECIHMCHILAKGPKLRHVPTENAGWSCTRCLYSFAVGRGASNSMHWDRLDVVPSSDWHPINTGVKLLKFHCRQWVLLFCFFFFGWDLWQNYTSFILGKDKKYVLPGCFSSFFIILAIFMLHTNLMASLVLRLPQIPNFPTCLQRNYFFPELHFLIKKLSRHWLLQFGLLL